MTKLSNDAPFESWCELGLNIMNSSGFRVLLLQKFLFEKLGASYEDELHISFHPDYILYPAYCENAKKSAVDSIILLKSLHMQHLGFRNSALSKQLS